MKSFKQYLTEAKMKPSDGLADYDIEFDTVCGGLYVRIFPLTRTGFNDANVFPVLKIGTYSGGDKVTFRPTNSEFGKWSDWQSMDDKSQKEYLDKIKKQSSDFAKNLEKLASEFDKKVLELAKKSGYEVKEDQNYEKL